MPPRRNGIEGNGSVRQSDYVKAIVFGAAFAAAPVVKGACAATDADDTPIRLEMTIEIAGGDETDVADPKKLKDSGLPMITDKPTAKSRDALAPAASATAAEPAKAPAEASKEAAPAIPAAPAAATAPEPAKAEAKPAPTFSYYLRLDGGAAIPQDADASGRNGAHRSSTFGNAPVIGGGIGINLDPAVRLEGALTYRGTLDIGGVDGAGAAVDGGAKSLDAMVNVFYDILQAHALTGSNLLTPYVGAGVGLAAIKTDDLTTAGAATEGGATSYNPGYALMAGVAARLNDALHLDVGYRFVNLGDAKQSGRFSDGSSAAKTSYEDILVHEVRAGLRLSF